MDVYIVAEAGSNWRISNDQTTNLNQAKKLIEIAKEAGANACKFQVFNSKKTYAPNAGNYDNYESINKLFDNLSLPKDWLKELKEHCDRTQIDFMASVFSIEDAKAVDPYVKRHKVASFECNHMELLEYLNLTDKPVLVSTGCAAWQQIERIKGAVPSSHLTLMHCISAYPAKNAELYKISKLKEICQSVGYSDHTEFNTITPVAAVAMGISYFEKHFTEDKNADGPDHKFALDPKELNETIRLIRQTEAVLYSYNEEKIKDFAVRRVQVISKIRRGDRLELNYNYGCLRPGSNKLGADAHLTRYFNNKRVNRDIEAGEGILLEDVE